MSPADDAPAETERGKEHASRPGLKTLLAGILAAIGITAIMYTAEIKALFS
jgi:hypothetical protein